jgi:hypothetical protein
MTDTSPEACGWPEQDAVDAWLSEHKIDVPFAAAMALKVAVTAWRIQMQNEAADPAAERDMARGRSNSDAGEQGRGRCRHPSRPGEAGGWVMGDALTEYYATEYHRRNMQVARVCGANASVDQALERARNVKSIPKWLIAHLESAADRLPGLQTDLAAWRDLADDAPAYVRAKAP